VILLDRFEKMKLYQENLAKVKAKKPKGRPKKEVVKEETTE
tara:strand:+ start:435 stop:557 length:123 start_codon:yes stop_codon:yes gene_type:complete